MSEQPKTYFIIRPVDYKPNDLIRLGQVITDPRKPFERLAEPLPLTGPLKPRVSPMKEWKVTNNVTGDSAVGLFAQVVNIVKAEASAGQSSGEVASWNAALLETRFFEISEDAEIPSYVERTARIPRVEKWLRENRHRGKTVYMITGLKIAKRPGKVAYDSSRDFNLDLNLQATVDPQGAVQAGVKGSTKSTTGTTQEATPQHAYVFAYRLRKLSVGWRDKTKLKLGGTKGGGELHGTKPEYGGMREQGEKEVEDEAEDGDDLDTYEMETFGVDKDDFGVSLPAKDKKIEAFDEEDNSPCLVIRTKNLGS